MEAEVCGRVDNSALVRVKMVREALAGLDCWIAWIMARIVAPDVRMSSMISQCFGGPSGKVTAA